MFEHLPKITEENLIVVIDKEIAYFTDLLRRCSEQCKTAAEAIDCMCEELNCLNPPLARAVKATAFAVFGELKDHMQPEIAWEAGITTIPGVLATLRLVDRALESREIEAKLT